MIPALPDSVKTKRALMTLLPDDKVLQLLSELKAAYDGFTWESAVWSECASRRSPYRTLVLFGLSARTRDALLADMCRQFFRRFPDAPTLAALRQTQGGRESVADAARSIVRPGQLPIVASIAQAVAQDVPRQRDALLRINGVGDKIAECVLAYGWGEEALPLDANCVRVLERVFGLEKAQQMPARLRESLKCVYRMRQHQFTDLSVAMVDIHEILRLHGQVCCVRTPECFRCPVSECRSRRKPWGGSSVIETPPAIWDDWRELINEPAAI
jgi:endonuclease III